MGANQIFPMSIQTENSTTALVMYATLLLDLPHTFD
jgi:hypothetical protein